jgi:hypothetical protein
MGLSEEQALLVLASLARAMFYKSMTTHADSSVWQDVYTQWQGGLHQVDVAAVCCSYTPHG